jgi:hypothetical protein
MSVLLVKGQFENWREQNFNTNELADWSLSGDTGEPANDNTPNLLKYALNIPAKSSTPASALPAIGSVTVSGSTYLTLTFTKQLALTDITYTPEVSGDLQTWQSGPAYTVRTDNGTTNTATYRDLTPLSTVSRRFMRLMVSRP